MPPNPELLTPEEKAAAVGRSADIDFDALEAAADAGTGAGPADAAEPAVPDARPAQPPRPERKTPSQVFAEIAEQAAREGPRVYKEMENFGEVFKKIGQAWESGEIETKMKELRDRYARAQENIRAFEGVMAKFGTWIKAPTQYGTEKYQVQEELRQAKEAYEAFYGNYVAERSTYLIKERGTLADRLADAYATKEKSWAREFYNGYKKLGEWNLEKVFAPKSRLGKFLGRIASVRTLISGGLLGLGVFAGAGAAVGAAAIGLRRVMSGLGTAGFSYDLMDHHARAYERTKGKLREVTEDEARLRLSDQDLIDRIAALETDAKLRGEKVSDNETYKMLLRVWAERTETGKTGALDYVLERGSKQVDTQFDKTLKDRQRADNWRKAGAVTLGTLIGSGALYKGIQSVREVFFGAPSAEQAAEETRAVAEAHAETAAETKAGTGADLAESVEAGPDGTVGITVNSEEAFLQDHSLLREQGFSISAEPDEKSIAVWVEIGKDGKFDHIQQALRRLVVDAMDPEKLHGAGDTFDHLDAGRAENMVANLTRILEDGKTTLGYSVEQLREMGISFDGQKLMIQDYAKFSALFNNPDQARGLFAHALETITNQSDALASVDNTSRRIWQELWDQKMRGSAIVQVEDFTENKFVQAANSRIVQAEQALGETDLAAKLYAKNLELARAIDLPGDARLIPDAQNPNLLRVAGWESRIAPFYTVGITADGKLARILDTELPVADQVSLSNAAEVRRVLTDPTPRTVIDFFYRHPRFGGIFNNDDQLNIGDHYFQKDDLWPIRDQQVSTFEEKYAEDTKAGANYELARRLTDNIKSGEEKLPLWQYLARHAKELYTDKYKPASGEVR